jgi:hypothetical protein
MRLGATVAPHPDNFVAPPTEGGTPARGREFVPPEGAKVDQTPDNRINEIEQTQNALRHSIEEARQLTDKARQLVQKHKGTVERRGDEA